jgi:hypothetical protein
MGLPMRTAAPAREDLATLFGQGEIFFGESAEIMRGKRQFSHNSTVASMGSPLHGRGNRIYF